MDCPHVYLSNDKVTTVVASNLIKANGIIYMADNKDLYVAGLKAEKTYKLKKNADATVSGKILFAQKWSDGMTINNKGKIYLTGNGITVYNSKGELIKHIAVLEACTASVCFGGK